MSSFLVVIFLHTVTTTCTGRRHLVFQWVWCHISLVQHIHTRVFVLRCTRSAIQPYSGQHFTITSKRFLQHPRWGSNLLCQILLCLRMADNFFNTTIGVLLPWRFRCYTFSGTMYCGVVQTANIKSWTDLCVRRVFICLWFSLTVSFI